MRKPLLLTVLATAATALAQSPIYSGVIPPATAFQGSTYINNTATQSTHLFDVDVTDPNGITVTGFDQRLSAYGSLPATYSIYVTAVGGTANGFQTDPTVWTQVASETVTQNSGTIFIPLSTPFFLAPGRYGMALHYDGVISYYTNANNYAVPQLYVANEVTLDCTFARIRRSTSADPFDPTTGGGWSPRHPQIAMHFITGPVSVNFAGTPLRGATPLQVQFSDYSFSGNTGGILARQWDFDNDGVVDSTAQNPLHTYTVCGDYTVSLTIIDITGPYTETKTDYVQTDLVTADFSAQMIAPNLMQFTDLSTPTPNSWDWDLDGDGITDSTLQNPTFQYTTLCTSVDVTLGVVLACRPQVSVTRPIAAAQMLETIYQGGLWINGTTPGGSNFIDVTVTNPTGISICGMNIRDGVPAGQPVTVNVWQKDGTYVGFERDATVWRQVAGETITTAMTGAVNFVPFTTPIYLAPGTHGLAIQQLGNSPVYTNLGSTQTYSNADLTITAGKTMDEPLFGAGSSIWNPRIWNGAIFYQTSGLTGAAGYGYIGEGCPGALGIPGNVVTSQPLIGTTMNAEIDKLPANAAIFVMGFSRTASALGALPFDLTPLGAPGCLVRVSDDATLFIAGINNVATFPFTIPSTTIVVGLQFYTQAFVFDAATNNLGGVTSDAAAMVIGM